MERKVVYHSTTAKVVIVGDPAGRPCCITFFTFSTNEAHLHLVHGFGEAALIKARVPAIHFINLQNHWWNIPDLSACLAAAAPYVSSASRRIGYGASMGGYAALRFSNALNMDEVLAFSPQFSIDRVKVPFEHRWEQHAALLDFSAEGMEISQSARHHIVFDPRSIDLNHAGLIVDANPDADITLHKVNAGDHFVIKEYQDAWLLPRILRGIGEGRVDEALLRAHPDHEEFQALSASA
jgi:hypothetical protein